MEENCLALVAFPYTRHCLTEVPIGPYSLFRVGASLLLTSGQIIRGANVENAAYPVGTCAERTALGTAVVEGARRGDIRALAVATDISPPASPCGMCRQYIREFCEVSDMCWERRYDGGIVMDSC